MKYSLPGKMDAADQDWAICLTIVFLAIGIAFAAMVPRGLPYDEPSHFNIVQLNAQLHGLPVVGRRGVTYEACQPPLYYFLIGLVYRAVISTGVLPLVAFYVCRVVTLFAACPLVYLTYRMARELSGRRSVARCAGILIAVNPGILAIASSIQNDSLAFLFSTLAAYLAIRWCALRTVSLAQMIVLSLLVAAAVLTKSSALPLIPFIGLIVSLADRRRAFGRMALFAAILLAATGWWFVRNAHLYGDWTGGRSVDSVFGAGHRFNPLSMKEWRWVIQSLITYYSTPVTYWRDQFKNPRWWTAAVAVGSICTVAGFAVTTLRGRLTRLNIWPVAFVLMCIGFWLLISYRNFVVAARIAMPALASALFLVAWMLCDLRAAAARLPAGRFLARCALPLLAILFLAADMHLLRTASRLRHLPYEIHPQAIATP
jgi:hypothetical protein